MTNPSHTHPHATPIRIALFGAGRHAQHHARAILRCPGAELIAVADPSDAAQAAMRAIVPGIKSYKTPEELLAAERPHVVHIITPPASHAPLAALALKAGSHIYVEKPFTERVEDAQRILDDARSKHLLVCAGHQLLYEPPTRVLADYLPSIGKVVHVESYFSFRTVRHAPGDAKCSARTISCSIFCRIRSISYYGSWSWQAKGRSNLSRWKSAKQGPCMPWCVGAG